MVIGAAITELLKLLHLPSEYIKEMINLDDHVWQSAVGKFRCYVCVCEIASEKKFALESYDCDISTFRIQDMLMTLLFKVVSVQSWPTSLLNYIAPPRTENFCFLIQWFIESLSIGN
ncbi:hypothetical protein ACJX0J_012909 [Zea mays]